MFNTRSDRSGGLGPEQLIGLCGCGKSQGAVRREIPGGIFRIIFGSEAYPGGWRYIIMHCNRNQLIIQEVPSSVQTGNNWTKTYVYI